MPGQRGSETRQRQHVYTIRWTADEAARLEEIAEASGCGKADVLRRLVAHDHGRIIPTRELTRQIVALGNNLNQIARSLSALRQQQSEPAAANLLANLQQTEQDLRRAHDAIVAIRSQMEDWR